MKKSELFQNIDTLMTEVLDLKKSWDSKMEKAEEEGESSDAMDDAVHMADHGEDEEGLAEYAKKLSDEELHELISSLVQEAEGRGGEEPAEEPEMEKAEEEKPAEGAEEQGEEGEEEEEAPESEESEGGDLDSKVAELSDEEIHTLMAAVQAELAKRGSDSSEKPESLEMSVDWKKVKADPKAPSEEQNKKHEEWLASKKKEEDESSEKMEKSLKAALKKIDDLTAQVAALKKSGGKKIEHGASVPTQKYADPKITVLEKSSSDSSKEVMTGATLANWLISEQASGNKKVNSDLVTKANLSKSVEEASEFYKELERIGIKAPRS